MTWTPPAWRLFADISDYQATFNARAYAHAGRRVVMIKAGEGAVDAGASRYSVRAQDAHANGLRVIHYLFADFAVGGELQLHAYCERLRPNWRHGDHMLIDVEAYSGPVSQAATWLGDAQAYLVKTQKAARALAYTNESYLAEGGVRLASQAPWWLVAAYDGRLLGQRGTPRLPAKARLLGKQYTDGATGAGPHDAPGIGACDNNILTPAGAAFVGAKAPVLRRKVLVKKC